MPIRAIRMTSVTWFSKKLGLIVTRSEKGSLLEAANSKTPTLLKDCGMVQCNGIADRPMKRFYKR
jgi:hypothetical protein